MLGIRPVQLLLGALIALLLLLQWSIWIGSPDAFDAIALRKQIAEQKLINEGLHERNAALGAEVRDLKQGSEAIEERARSDLGMVKKGETFYQVIAPANAPPATTPISGAAPAIAPAISPGKPAANAGEANKAAAPTTRPPDARRPDRRP